MEIFGMCFVLQAHIYVTPVANGNFWNVLGSAGTNYVTPVAIGNFWNVLCPAGTN
jgi:hypothetical protein